MAKPQPKAPRQHPFAVIRRAREELGIDRVMVGISGGKDSLATLDLCCEHFPPGCVHGYFLYLVPGLSFQERYLAYLERRFRLSITRLPHWMLSFWFQENHFRHQTAVRHTTRLTRIRDVEAHLRAITGVEWFATGEKCCDSLERNTQIVQCGGINPQRRRIFPLGFWSHAAVYNYIKQKNIALPPEYATADGGSASSFGSFWERDIKMIREHYPDDFAKIKKMFPLIESQGVRYSLRDEMKKVAEAASAAEHNGEHGIDH